MCAFVPECDLTPGDIVVLYPVWVASEQRPVGSTMMSTFDLDSDETVKGRSPAIAMYMGSVVTGSDFTWEKQMIYFIYGSLYMRCLSPRHHVRLIHSVVGSI